MKTLYITRHAQADKKENPSHADIERPLKKEGKREALEMAQRLHRMNVIPEQVISSPAIRAKMTAETMMKEWGSQKEDLKEEGVLFPGNADEILLWIAASSNHYDQLLIVGHQPELSRLVELLTEASPGPLPPCSVVSCEFETDDWNAVVRGSGHLKWVLTPSSK
ncbi:MAG: histidine phosphatase family protein [Flavobacteriales bacterium]